MSKFQVGTSEYQHFTKSLERYKYSVVLQLDPITVVARTQRDELFYFDSDTWSQISEEQLCTLLCNYEQTACYPALVAHSITRH